MHPLYEVDSLNVGPVYCPRLLQHQQTLTTEVFPSKRHKLEFQERWCSPLFVSSRCSGWSFSVVAPELTAHSSSAMTRIFCLPQTRATATFAAISLVVGETCPSWFITIELHYKSCWLISWALVYHLSCCLAQGQGIILDPLVRSRMMILWSSVWFNPSEFKFPS